MSGEFVTIILDTMENPRLPAATRFAIKCHGVTNALTARLASGSCSMAKCRGVIVATTLTRGLGRQLAAIVELSATAQTQRETVGEGQLPCNCVGRIIALTIHNALGQTLEGSTVAGVREQASPKGFGEYESSPPPPAPDSGSANRTAGRARGVEARHGWRDTRAGDDGRS